MDKQLFNLLRHHIGHKIACVSYGNPVVNISIECEDCGQVILDTDVYELKG